jgi:hypothetical protein
MNRGGIRRQIVGLGGELAEFEDAVNCSGIDFMPTVIEANFFADYVSHMKRHLATKGIALDGTETDDEVVIGVFNRVMREISTKPRNAHKAKSFTVPAEYQSALAVVEKEIAGGADLTPRLSKNLLDFEFVDSMLADFGIHHLHLGSTLEPSGFMERSGPLLYARFEPDDAFLLGIFRHGEWASNELIEILHANWPERIAHLKMKGALGMQQAISSEDRKHLRKASINAPVQLRDGTMYTTLGGGLSSSGTPGAASMQLIGIRRSLRHHQARVTALVQASLTEHPATGSVKVSLVLDQGGRAVEPYTGFDERLW